MVLNWYHEIKVEYFTILGGHWQEKSDCAVGVALSEDLLGDHRSLLRHNVVGHTVAVRSIRVARW